MVTNKKSAELPCCAWQRHRPGLGSLVEVPTVAVCGKNKGRSPWDDTAPPQPLSPRPCFQPQHQEQNRGHGGV